MDELKNGVIEEYASSLGDLSFNSKPLINVLTMLAEENVQFASSITKLISDRVLRVRAEWKLPSLYLLDSIVKNIGGDYLQAVAEVIRSVFVSVFEKGDEKVRRDLFKLRNTWPSYFSVNVLYDIDMHVNKVDPNWPITAVPPPSPTIHINPKFLKKAEEESANKELENIKSIKETAVMDEYQNKHLQLQALQDEQMKLHSCELEELRLKQELLMKKQQKERLLLVKQQQQQILKLRLQGEEDADFASSNGPSTPPNLERTQPVAPGPLKRIFLETQGLEK